MTVQRRWGAAFLVRHGDRYFVNNDAGFLIIAQFTPEGYVEIDRTPAHRADLARRLRPAPLRGPRRQLDPAGLRQPSPGDAQTTRRSSGSRWPPRTTRSPRRKPRSRDRRRAPRTAGVRFRCAIDGAVPVVERGGQDIGGVPEIDPRQVAERHRRALPLRHRRHERAGDGQEEAEAVQPRGDAEAEEESRRCRAGSGYGPSRSRRTRYRPDCADTPGRSRCTAGGG